MKKLILTVAVVAAIAGVTAATTQEAYAFGGRGKGIGPSSEHREEIMAEKAEFLGITVDELKEAWENRTVHELLEEKGLTREDVWNYIKDTVIEHMREMGLSEDEINERLERREEKHQRMQEWRENNPDAEPPFRGHWKNR